MKPEIKTFKELVFSDDTNRMFTLEELRELAESIPVIFPPLKEIERIDKISNKKWISLESLKEILDKFFGITKNYIPDSIDIYKPDIEKLYKELGLK